MCLAVVCKDVLHVFVNGVSLLCTSLFYHLDAAKGLDGTLEQFVSLQTNNQLVFLINIASLVRADGRHCVGVE